MKPLHHMSLWEAHEHVARKDISCVELTQAFLAQMERYRSLNAYITETPDHALKQAQHADQRWAKGEARPLEGLPIAIKDIFCTQGIRTTAGSSFLENFIPPYESTVTQRLWDAGAVCLGKTNMDEFAMGSANTSSAFGPVTSPWRSRSQPDQPLVPGGSSGGSSAVVAAGMALAALGTDTGGSIRQPASFTGLVGLKPTYGRCSRFGMVALASSLDQAGPLTHTVRDAALILRAIAGGDPHDATSVFQDPPPSFDACQTSSLKGLRVGIVSDYEAADAGIAPDIRQWFAQACRWLEEAGATLVPISLPHARYALAAYYIILPAEASSNLARYDGVRFGLRVEGTSPDEMYEKTRDQGFGDEVKRRILIGTYVLSSGYYDAYYTRAQKVRQLVAQDFHHAFQDVSCILTPTTPNTAFPLGEYTQDPVQMYMNDVLTVTANIAGIPALSIPVGLDQQGLPVGMQLLASHGREDHLLTVGSILEACAGFDLSQVLPHPMGFSERVS